MAGLVIYLGAAGVLACVSVLVSEYITMLLASLTQFQLQVIGYTLLLTLIILFKRLDQPVAAILPVAGLWALVTYTLTGYLLIPEPDVYYYDALAGFLITFFATTFYNHISFGYITWVIFFGLWGLEVNFGVVMKVTGLAPITLGWIGLGLGLPAAYLHHRDWKVAILDDKKTDYLNNYVEPYLFASFGNFLTAVLFLVTEWHNHGARNHRHIPWWWALAFALGHVPLRHSGRVWKAIRTGPNGSIVHDDNSIMASVLIPYALILGFQGYIVIESLSPLLKYWVGLAISLGAIYVGVKELKKD